MKSIGFTLIAAAIASLGGCALYDNAKRPKSKVSEQRSQRRLITSSGQVIR